MAWARCRVRSPKRTLVLVGVGLRLRLGSDSDLDLGSVPFFVVLSPGTKVSFKVSQVSWSRWLSTGPRRTTTLRSNWTSVGAGRSGGPTATGVCGLGMSTRIVESQCTSSGVGSFAAGRRSLLLIGSTRHLSLDLNLPRRDPLGLGRPRQDARLADVAHHHMNVLVQIKGFRPLETRRRVACTGASHLATEAGSACPRPVTRMSRSWMTTSDSLRICSVGSSYSTAVSGPMFMSSLGSRGVPWLSRIRTFS